MASVSFKPQVCKTFQTRLQGEKVMPLPTETITLQPYRMKDNPDHIVAAVEKKVKVQWGFA